MPLNHDFIMNAKVPALEARFTKRDTMLYALGIGIGQDPLDERQLRFVYEKELEAVPCMIVVMATTGVSQVFVQKEARFTTAKGLHAEQGFELLRPMPVEGTIVGQARVTRILDKGAEKGAVIHNTTTLRDQASGEVIAYAHSTSIARADGGFGGPRGPEEPKQAIPDTPPDKVCDLPTYPNAGLLYRLAALDYNPLHSDPAFARRAGFDRPILHGRCTYAIACHAILREVCGYDPGRLRSMRARFSAPVYPGETIRTEMWVDGRIVTFRSTIPARGGVVVLDNGRAELNG